MRILRNRRAFRRWAAGVERGQPQCPLSEPERYPCFGYLTVLSFGMEEEQARYLYPAQIRAMKRTFDKIEDTK